MTPCPQQLFSSTALTVVVPPQSCRAEVLSLKMRNCIGCMFLALAEEFNQYQNVYHVHVYESQNLVGSICRTCLDTLHVNALTTQALIQVQCQQGFKGIILSSLLKLV